MGAASPEEAFLLLRVLVADSGSSVNDGLTALLTDIDGISVFGCAQEEDKILSLARSLRPDAVILDIQRRMPVDLGLVGLLKAMPGTPAVIALCDDVSQPLEEAVSASGADYTLRRTDSEGLVALISKMIEKRREDG
jgi:DNA-binding NarL/FixJ family response regulator